MRASKLLFRTLREAPGMGRTPASLLVRAGYLSQRENGFSILPLGMRVCDRFACLLSGSKQSIWITDQDEFLRPETLASLLEREVQSYRELPRHIRLHGARLPSPHLPRGKRMLVELLAAESAGQLTVHAAKAMEAGRSQLRKFGVELKEVDGPEGCRFLGVDDPHGSLMLAVCSRCGWRWPVDSAAFGRIRPQAEDAAPLRMVETPDCETIADLAAYLQVEQAQILKVVFLEAEDGELLMLLLQGNYTISLPKLTSLTGSHRFRPAKEVDILAAGAVPGYASPIGLAVAHAPGESGLRVIADDSVLDGVGYVAGANRKDCHFTGAQYQRDFTITQMADIAEVTPGSPCPSCGERLTIQPHLVHAEYQPIAMTFNYSGEHGKAVEGSAGVLTWDLLTILITASRIHADEHGLMWPPQLSPFDVHVVDLRQPEETEAVIKTLENRELCVLHDDRSLSPGVKFKDADLLGCPIRITVSRRSLKGGGVEVYFRQTGEQETGPLAALLPQIVP